MFIFLVLALLLDKGILGFPFGGWGPGEGFGNTGFNPPPGNPNSDFGYDRFGITFNQFNYSAVVLQRREPKSMRNPLFTSVAPRVPKVLRRGRGGSMGRVGRGSRIVPVFRPRPIPRRGRGGNAGKVPAFRPRSAAGRESSNVSVLTPRPPQGRDQRFHRKTKKNSRSKSPKVPPTAKVKLMRKLRKSVNQLGSKPPRKNFKKSTKKTGRKSLSAGDIWRLNRTAKKFLGKKIRGESGGQQKINKGGRRGDRRIWEDK